MQKLVAITVLMLSSSCFADLKYRIHLGGITNHDQIVFVQGQRIRQEDPNNPIVVIKQCDQLRTIRLNTEKKTYTITPITAPSQPAPPQSTDTAPQTAPAATENHCTVQGKREVIEKKEHKQIFGRDARHIIFRERMEPGGSCAADRKLASFVGWERDGWYAELPDLPECPATTEADRLGVLSYSAPDKYLQANGNLSPALLPLELKVKVPRGSKGLQAAYTADIVELSTGPLDSSLFDIPSGYRGFVTAEPDCAKKSVVLMTASDGTPVYRVGCGVAAPVPVYSPDPSYTDAARNAKVSGIVGLSVIVNPDGTVRDVQVERSLRPDLDQQSIATLRTWRFIPATKEGIAVAVKLTIQTSFSVY
ncbi:MAG TPA: energy transducer TonB [Terriglobales bacterium]|jgi:TonB family protein|nr:energy transducer TonB [Terriglobales bacterium]